MGTSTGRKLARARSTPPKPVKRRPAPNSLGPPAAELAKQLRDACDRLDFNNAAPWVYNPLQYAWPMHEAYLKRYARSSCRVLLLGMNPGPWGMAQTGVPFGEINAVQQFLQLKAPISQPHPEHPKRPIEGLNCGRSEVSGKRLWGFFAERFGTADAFFDEHFVANYCPLVFMEDSARNLTPDKLPAELRTRLESVCDRHLNDLIQLLTPEWVVGVGGFAEKCAQRVLDNNPGNQQPRLGKILHPSPASPAANRDWAGTALKQLVNQGIWAA